MVSFLFTDILVSVNRQGPAIGDDLQSDRHTTHDYFAYSKPFHHLFPIT